MHATAGLIAQGGRRVVRPRAIDRWCDSEDDDEVATPPADLRTGAHPAPSSGASRVIVALEPLMGTGDADVVRLAERACRAVFDRFASDAFDFRMKRSGDGPVATFSVSRARIDSVRDIVDELDRALGRGAWDMSIGADGRADMPISIRCNADRVRRGQRRAWWAAWWFVAGLLAVLALACAVALARGWVVTGLPVIAVAQHTGAVPVAPDGGG